MKKCNNTYFILFLILIDRNTSADLIFKKLKKNPHEPHFHTKNMTRYYRHVYDTMTVESVSNSMCILCYHKAV